MFDSLLPILQVAANSTDVGTLAQQVTTADTTSTALGISGIVAGAAAGLKTLFSDKNQKNNQMQDDFDNEKQRELMNIENNLTLMNPTKTRAEILNMSAYPDQPALKLTLGEAYALDYEEYKKYNIKTWYQKK